MRLRAGLVFGLVCALTLAVFLGCKPRETPVMAGIRTQTLHRGLAADPSELDPHIITGLPEINVAVALFEGLVNDNPADPTTPLPGVAESWDAASDGLTYTFHLRANARWSNDAPLTAQDFVNSVQRMVTKSLGADYATMLYLVANAEAYHKGTLTDFSQVGIKALDARTLRITLDHPAPYFLSMLTHPAWFPVYLPALEKSGSPYQRGSKWTRPENIVSNGPFTLKTWRPGEVLVAEKSPTYWDSAHVRLNAIHFHPAADVDSEERAFRAGQLHLTESLPVGKVDTYRRTRPAELQITPFLDTYFYRLNTTRPGLNNPKIRQALSLAIDRAAIVEKITRGGQQPALSFTPPGAGTYRPPEAIRHDLAQARALLAEAGHPEGRDLPIIEITINSSGNHRAIAEAIQEMWRRDLGVDVRINNMEQGSLLSKRRQLDYQVMRSDWAGDYLDATTFLKVFTSDSNNNHTSWKNADYDRLLYESDRTADAAARELLLQRAESILLADLPILPLYYFTAVRLVHPSVKGWRPTVLDRPAYKQIYLEP